MLQIFVENLLNVRHSSKLKRAMYEIQGRHGLAGPPPDNVHLSSACLPALSNMNRALIAFYLKLSLVIYNSCSQFYFLILLSFIHLKTTFLNSYFIIFVSACVNVGHLSTHVEAKQGHWISWSWTCRWLIATGYRG